MYFPEPFPPIAPLPLPFDLEPPPPFPQQLPPSFTFSDSDSDEEYFEGRERFHDEFEEMDRAWGSKAQDNLELSNRNACRKIRKEKAELEKLCVDSSMIRACAQELRCQFATTEKIIEANANAYDKEKTQVLDAHQAVTVHLKDTQPDFTPFAKKTVKKAEKIHKPKESANASSAPSLGSRLLDAGLDTMSMLPLVGVPVPPEISGSKKLLKDFKEKESSEPSSKPFIQKLVCDISIDTLKETMNVTTAMAAGQAVGVSTIFAPPLTATLSAGASIATYKAMDKLITPIAEAAKKQCNASFEGVRKAERAKTVETGKASSTLTPIPIITFPSPGLQFLPRDPFIACLEGRISQFYADPASVSYIKEKGIIHAMAEQFANRCVVSNENITQGVRVALLSNTHTAQFSSMTLSSLELILTRELPHCAQKLSLPHKQQ